MIVVKGDTVQSLPSELTLRQKLEAFVKYHSTQVVLFFGTLAALWQAIPDDLKQSLFTEIPFLAKWKTIIYLATFVYTFYASRMSTQVVSVAPVTPTPDSTLPPPLVLVPSTTAPLVPTVVPPTV